MKIISALSIGFYLLSLHQISHSAIFQSFPTASARPTLCKERSVHIGNLQMQQAFNLERTGKNRLPATEIVPQQFTRQPSPALLTKKPIIPPFLTTKNQLLVLGKKINPLLRLPSPSRPQTQRCQCNKRMYDL